MAIENKTALKLPTKSIVSSGRKRKAKEDHIKSQYVYLSDKQAKKILKKLAVKSVDAAFKKLCEESGIAY